MARLSCKSLIRRHFEDHGHKYLMAITMIEAIFFLGLSIVYLIVAGMSETISIQLNSLYRFFFMLILFVFLVYFIWHSVVRQTVMELLSFVALLVMLNVFFIYRETVVLANY